MINRGNFKKRYSEFDHDIILDILDLFINDYNERISRIAKDLSEHNPSSLKKDAHAFKGIIGNIDPTCLAFQHIGELEELSEDLMSQQESEEKISPEIEKAKYDEMLKHFVLFKDSSLKLLNDTKDLRMEYSGDGG